MAFVDVENVRIAGVSVCIPERTVENSEYEVVPAESRDKFISAIGIERRHCVGKGVCTSDMCVKAAEHMLDKIGWNRQEVELVVLVTQTPDYKMPTTASVIQHRLGLPTSCMAFDISMGCSGYVYGLGVAGKLMESGSIKKALLMVGNTQSLNTNYYDQSAYPLFGDGGSVTALEYSPERASEIKLSYITDGSGEFTIYIPDGGYRNPVSPHSFETKEFEGGIHRNRLNLVMKGDDVFSFVISQVPAGVRAMYEHYDIDPEGLDYYLIHHASKFLFDKLRKKMKLDEDKTPVILKDYGNSSNAGIPLLMVTKLKEKVENTSVRVLITGFGVGLSMGCGVISLDRLECADLITI